MSTILYQDCSEKQLGNCAFNKAGLQGELYIPGTVLLRTPVMTQLVCVLPAL